MTALERRLENIEQYILLASKEVLNINEAIAYTTYSKRTLYELTSNKRIPHYKRDGKLFFKKSELTAWMLANPVKTEEEIQAEANSYIYHHSK